jgi:Mn-dependent DtxR family transcriptional regulator
MKEQLITTQSTANGVNLNTDHSTNPSSRIISIRKNRVSDISEKMGVTKASVNSAMSTLASKGLIINEKYKAVFLTPSGLEQAKMTSKKHRIIFEFSQKF